MALPATRPIPPDGHHRTGGRRVGGARQAVPVGPRPELDRGGLPRTPYSAAPIRPSAARTWCRISQSLP